MSLQEPKLKKPKLEEKQQEEEEEEEEAEETEEDTKVEIQRNDDGDAFVDLTGKKRLTIRSYKGKTLVDIREYYEKGDKLLPGKKGISLNVEQFKALRASILDGHIDKEIADLEK